MGGMDDRLKSSATDNFSYSNKLGQGGYGPVYKRRVLYAIVEMNYCHDETAENCLQKLKLPEPVLCIGGILQVEEFKRKK
ncbi:hypothetical protein PIB30_072414 [Stylosanthes scabra]|uniref:Protein kinase domain-containing protein n=1 Tax=Stylosanthes scabra TaxID=79078 RepID=A0ABU6TP77_9FABA|nr:hypothetical protein [Stylosanthes scabra]